MKRKCRQKSGENLCPSGRGGSLRLAPALNRSIDFFSNQTKLLTLKAVDHPSRYETRECASCGSVPGTADWQHPRHFHVTSSLTQEVINNQSRFSVNCPVIIRLRNVSCRPTSAGFGFLVRTHINNSPAVNRWMESAAADINYFILKCSESSGTYSYCYTRLRRLLSFVFRIFVYFRYHGAAEVNAGKRTLSARYFITPSEINRTD